MPITPRTPAIAIIGGAGFIGLACAEAARAMGCRVALLDLAPPPAGWLTHPALAGASFHPCDLRDPASLQTALAEAQPDLVLHLAALTPDAAQIRQSADRIVALNVAGIATAMTAAADFGIPRFAMTSSVALYGTKGPWPEQSTLTEDGPLCPDSLYGLTRGAAEDLARLLAPEFGLSLQILRLGPVFGPWERAGATRPNLSPHAQIEALAQDGLPATLPHEMRADWLYSRDAGEIIAGLLCLWPETGTDGTVFNIGAGQLSSPADWAALTGLPPVRIDAHAPSVTARMAQGRPPLDTVRSLRALQRPAASRSLAAAAEDYLRWRADFPDTDTPETVYARF
ncbi:NAD-dependent epimerase/dehydratase family protein [Thioclava kandeliae]|uniref:NAD(P)-dependent oxidoreductase n=1 Tax=Thioclava kandeliae TaxID=3070818 RepID=A0ABV1SJX7_9RHOB